MKNFNISKFMGVNKADNPQDLKPYECTDLQNVRITKEKILKRVGTTLIGTIGAGNVRNMQSVRGIMTATLGTVVRSLSGSTWSDILTGIHATRNTKFIEFPVAVAKGTPVTATITDITNNGLTVTASGASWTDNDYVGDIFRTSGQTNGAKQYRRIVLNDATTLTLAEPLNIHTDASNSLYIENPTDGTFFFNGGTPQKTTAAALNSWTNFEETGYTFQYATVYKNRVIGVKASSHTVYVSPLLTGEDFPYEYEIAAGTKSYITGIDVFGDQLLIQKGDDGVWIGVADDTSSSGSVFSFAERTEANGALKQESVSIGENIMFYVSTRGIEWFNPLETNELEGHLALSDYKVPELRGVSTNNAAVGITFDAKYYCAINSKVYIFDIARYLQLLQAGVKDPYVFLIDDGYTPLSFAELSGDLYIGAASKVYKFTGTTDNTTAITSYWEKDGIILKDPARMKVLRLVSCVHSGGAASDKLTITASTEKETNTLDTITFVEDHEAISGNRSKGKNHKLKFDITSIGTGSLENADLFFEIGKIVK